MIPALGVNLTFYALAAIAALWTWDACRNCALGELDDIEHDNREDD